MNFVDVGERNVSWTLLTPLAHILLNFPFLFSTSYLFECLVNTSCCFLYVGSRHHMWRGWKPCHQPSRLGRGFFPNISYIKYEVCEFLCQVEFPIIFLDVIEFASYHRLAKCRLKGIKDLILLLYV